MILKKLARVRVFPEGHPRRWEVTLKVWKLTSDEVHEGLTPETSASNSQRWPVELIIPNYLEIHSHWRSTTVSTETTPLFRWYIIYRWCPEIWLVSCVWHGNGKVFRIVVQYTSTYMTCLLVVCCVRGHVMHLLFLLQNFALWTQGNLTKMLSRALKEHQANQAVQREKQGILIFTQSNRNFFGFVVREQLFCNWIAGPCIRSDVH